MLRCTLLIEQIRNKHSNLLLFKRNNRRMIDSKSRN